MTDGVDDVTDKPRRTWPTALVVLIVAVVLLVVGLCFAAWWAASVARSGPLDEGCLQNLKQLCLAMHNYHDVHRCFPPASYVDDADTNPHSWRIRVLPYAEQNVIYDRYDFSQPWDSPHNVAAAQGGRKGVGGPRQEHDYPFVGPPLCYFCPSEPDSQEQEQTSYVAIVGPHAALPVKGKRRLSDFQDGTANTIMLAEIDHNRMHWLEPRDLDAEHMSFRINDPTQPSISSRHPHGPGVVMADGSAYRLSPETSTSVVQALITIDGGEDMDVEKLLAEGLLQPIPRLTSSWR